MDYHSRLCAEAILEGTAEVEDGYIHSITAGDGGKESAVHVVEVLDEVHKLLLASFVMLKQDTRHWLPPTVNPLCGRSAWPPSQPCAPSITRCLPDAPTPVTSSSNINLQFVSGAQKCGMVLWMGLG